MIDWLVEPLTFTFMQKALLASLIVGVVCAVIGCYVVLRSMAFLGDALAHAILPGVAVAYLVGANLLAGALVAGLLVAVGISFVSRAGTIKEDTAIGIFFAAALLSSHISTGDLRRGPDPSLWKRARRTATDLWISGLLALAVRSPRLSSTSSYLSSRSTRSWERPWDYALTLCGPACSRCWPPPSSWRCRPWVSRWSLPCS
jgi:tetrahydromethanopterin S-methyltransferase subunit D